MIQVPRKYLLYIYLLFYLYIIIIYIYINYTPPWVAEDGSGGDSALGLTEGSAEAWTVAVATTAVAVRNALAALRAPAVA